MWPTAKHWPDLPINTNHFQPQNMYIGTDGFLRQSAWITNASNQSSFTFALSQRKAWQIFRFGLEEKHHDGWHWELEPCKAAKRPYQSRLTLKALTTLAAGQNLRKKNNKVTCIPKRLVCHFTSCWMKKWNLRFMGHLFSGFFFSKYVILNSVRSMPGRRQHCYR